ncbi:MAG: hypothetical protein H6584_05765 [Flavobacteriales bacterium]|nr:hypothetical protein [Flavobacteriales bacterium]
MQKLVTVCFFNFLIAALMGLVLRYYYIAPVGINYRFLTHAHSHVAMLGWVYLMLYSFLFYYFIPNKTKVFYLLFWITELSVVGMMISFPIQGYALFSIAFSTLHILCSYYFVYLIWKKSKTKTKVVKSLLRAALIFMIVSTFGVWCLGPAVTMDGKASAFYQVSIQFFLHFQFNGWFLFGVLAILFHLFEVRENSHFTWFYRSLMASILLTLALPVHWFIPHTILLWINGLGLFFQVIALYYFFKIITLRYTIFQESIFKLTSLIFGFAVFCFALKIIMQTISIIPEFSDAIYQQRNIVIGFIHLLMLGVISGFLFYFVVRSQFITFNKTLSIGIYSFIIGFVLTEIMLLTQGYRFYTGKGLVTNYYLLLFLFSVFLLIGIGIIFFNVIKHKKYGTPTTKKTQVITTFE